MSATTASPPNFLVSVPGTQQAGTRFQATLTATTNGVTVDTTYRGNKTITFSGPSSSPAGNAPVYPATVRFTNGVGRPQIRLYAAETVTLAVTDGIRSGSTPVTVTAAVAQQLRFSTSTPSCASGSVAVGNGGSFTSRVTVYDQYLNPRPETTNRTITLTKNRPTGTLVPVSLTIPIGSSETSASFTFTLPVGNPPATRITAASGGVTNVRCVVSRN